MKYKYLLTLLFAGFLVATTGQHAYAAPVANDSAGPSSTSAPSSGAVDCAILPQALCDAASQKPGTSGSGVENTGIFKLLEFILTIMTALVGIAAVGALVYAGVLYSSAGGTNEQVAKSKKLITDTVIGLVVYALMFFALNWLIPGGILK